MEREHRDFDRETEEERPEHELLRAERQADAHQVGDFEAVGVELRVVLEIEGQDAEQHQHRACERVEEKLDRGVQLARAAPHPDDEVHRHQHELPENVEEEEIERDEDADHASLQQQEHRIVFLDAILHRRPGAEDRDEAHQRGEHQEQQADAIDADVIVRAERGNPIGALLELKAREATLEAPNQRERNRKPGQSGEICPDADEVLVPSRKKQQDGQSGQRCE